MAVDLLVFGRERHEHTGRFLGSVNREIDREGLVLYDPEDGKRTDRRAIGRLAGR